MYTMTPVQPLVNRGRSYNLNTLRVTSHFTRNDMVQIKRTSQILVS